MKLRSLILLLLSISQFSFVYAQFDTKVINHDGLNRTYYIHVPANYNASNPAAVVVWLHGMGNISVAEVKNQYPAHQFVPIADTANFIILVPVAEDFPLLNMRAWNSQAGMLGISPNTDVDDFGYIDAMLDEVIDSLSINQNKIFICGFSMGGFMTQRFALQHNNRFAAYASVGGTIGGNVLSMTPGRPIRIAHFHGTQDATVGYVNNTFGMGAEEMLNFWIDNNACDTSPSLQLTYTDNDPTNMSSILVDYSSYLNANADVEFHKLNGATHTWPVQTSQKIWDFFSKYEGVVSIKKNNPNKDLIKVYPNPATNFITIQLPNKINSQILISDIQGRILFSKQLNAIESRIDIKEIGLRPGIYFIQIIYGSNTVFKKIIIK
ncbi:MAG TPA: T9SS type A sorting domain-containing protein [Edaphocola sp.]|nr:T9SS type A sorting domain-containing protein [Edaphocola sp.]